MDWTGLVREAELRQAICIVRAYQVRLRGYVAQLPTGIPTIGSCLVEIRGAGPCQGCLHTRQVESYLRDTGVGGPASAWPADFFRMSLRKIQAGHWTYAETWVRVWQKLRGSAKAPQVVKDLFVNQYLSSPAQTFHVNIDILSATGSYRGWHIF